MTSCATQEYCTYHVTIFAKINARAKMTFSRSALAVALFSLVVSVSADGKCNIVKCDYFGQLFRILVQ